MSSALKKGYCLLLLFLVTLLSPTTVFAQQYDYLSHGGTQFGYTIPFGAICALTGIAPIPNKKCPGVDDKGKLGLYNVVPGGGVVGGLTTIVTAMYTNPPTSSKQYLANLGVELGIVDEAHAQVAGSGASIIEPIRLLWQVTRNFTYLSFIIVFLVVGFMIMLRQKISQNAAVTAQTALPGLVVGLILVTFSYFISALLVDTSFVGIQVSAQTFTQVINPKTNKVMNAFGNAEDLQNLANESNLFSMFTSSVRYKEGFGSDDITGAVQGTLDSIPGAGAAITMVIGAVILGIIGLTVGGMLGFIGGVVGLGVGAGVGSSVGAAFDGSGIAANVIGLILPVVLILALVIQFFRLAFKLISAYISILVFTVLGPLIILYSSIPGKGNNLSFWWKTILANSLVFPAVFAVFLFAGMILATDPQSWEATPPLFGNLSTELMRIIIAYGLLLGLPAVPDMVKNAMGVKDLQGIPQTAASAFNIGAEGAGDIAGRGYTGFMRYSGLAARQEALKKRKVEEDARALGDPRDWSRWYRFLNWIPQVKR